MTTGMQQNQMAFDRNCEAYLDRPVSRPELELLRLYKDRWPLIDMLDLGVGTGRTALTFSILAKSYVGVDYAPRMIDWCKALIGESDTVRFVVADATDLSPFYDRRFDVVLFSFNGIDCVSHEQRLKVFAEVRKVLKADGCFFFSSHSLNVLPFKLRFPARGGNGYLRWGYRCYRRLAWFLRQRLVNRGIRIDEARRRGWAIISDGELAFRTRFYYVLPEFQVKQLEEAGFEVVAVYDNSGKPIDWRTPTDDNWLHYLCRSRDVHRAPLPGPTLMANRLEAIVTST
jgi:SAM-dependent methyltransferase